MNNLEENRQSDYLVPQPMLDRKLGFKTRQLRRILFLGTNMMRGNTKIQLNILV